MARIDTRSNILNAALELFASNGYTNTTTRLIADVAGVNEVTIFRHFGSKEALYQEVISYAVDRLKFPGRTATYKQMPPAEVIRTIGVEYVHNCFNTEGLYKIQMKIQDDIQGLDKLRFSKSYIDTLTEYLTWLQSEGKIHTNPKDIATNFIYSILGVFTYYVLTGECTAEYVHKLANDQIETFIEFYKLI